MRLSHWTIQERLQTLYERTELFNKLCRKSSSSQETFNQYGTSLKRWKEYQNKDRQRFKIWSWWRELIERGNQELREERT